MLRGEVAVRLRQSVSLPPQRRSKRSTASEGPRLPLALDDAAQVRYLDLKAWRAEVARAHNLPAYVIFHDATLAAIAERAPQTLDALQGISGIGARKLEAYGMEVLRVLGRSGW